MKQVYIEKYFPGNYFLCTLNTCIITQMLCKLFIKYLNIFYNSLFDLMVKYD